MPFLDYPGLTLFKQLLDNKFDDMNARNGHHYGARWNKSTAKMERTGDAAGITTTLTNFGHFGSVNANYDNPFDSIYPWSGCKLCNIDLEKYLALEAGEDIRNCVVAWEGDPDFSYTHDNGVWKFRPEFWGKSWDEGGYRYFDITDRPEGSYVHYEPTIVGRWRGVKETREISGASKSILLPKPGMPCKREAISTIHGYAKNGGMTLDNIFELDGSYLMCIIEAADFNVQRAWGKGVSAMYRESSDKILAAVTDENVITVAASAFGNARVGSIIDIGTANGGVQVGSYYVTALETSGSNMLLTLNENVTVTTDHFVSLHGRINVADEEIGSMSGYIGTNGQADCYYRGESFWGNIWLHVLGAYHQANTNHIWLAEDGAAADGYDAINTADHWDTGVVIAGSTGWIKSLGFLDRSGVLSAPIFCTEVGGSDTNPVGDYFYNAPTSNTILLVGGSAGDGLADGLCADWSLAASNSNWLYGGRPLLKSP